MHDNVIKASCVADGLGIPKDNTVELNYMEKLEQGEELGGLYCRDWLDDLRSKEILVADFVAEMEQAVSTGEKPSLNPIRD